MIPLYRRENSPILYLDECRCFEYYRNNKWRNPNKKFKVIKYKSVRKFPSNSPDLIDSCSKVFIPRILRVWVRTSRTVKYMSRIRDAWDQSFGLNFLKNYCKICKYKEHLIYRTIVKWKKYAFRPNSHYYWMTIIKSHYPVDKEEYQDRPGE